MDHIRKAVPFLRPRKDKEEEDERSSNFLKNGSLVLEELIESFGGRYKLPIKSFTAKQLIRASNNFSEKVPHMTDNGYMFRGNLESRPILVKLYSNIGDSDKILHEAIHDLVITSQMSHLKNVLKLIGCSFEFKCPAIVYEYAGTELLYGYLRFKNDVKRLSCGSRIKIAKDIASVICYLHSAFPTPIIYRDLTPNKVIIDQCGVAKLFDFTFSISLPPGELQVEDLVKGTYGYLEPQYAITGFITQKTDVYGFGILMLVLFTGETAIMKYREGTVGPIHVRDYVKACLDNAQINQIVDPQFFEGESNDGLRQNLLAFLDLALRCTEYEITDRPDMLDVAKELLHIEKSVHC